ncbi:MAG: protein arginine kinase [Candidatus Scalindua sp.]|mgnify:FL=1|jgi:protein arginine kinase|nr:protein arginine kinase [Candidatus Scalindua sp.]MBT5307475.1 protein arginine kinase [Candidatus Scalindua sp.]MBT6052220.1 protein arginine kinase [Candidatus Scalindua sp.]MBT6230244.1 protein arginine kinase [Candidatus Scalindua sp.]MBT7212741.1 protein arginine kinase [Candidatus Scalindua sp.]
MEIKDLSDNTGEWLRGTGKESDIVISSRIRLARNITGYPFLSRANLKQRKEVESLLRKTIIEHNIARDVSYVNLNQATAVDKLFLVERHLISKEHAEGEGERGVAFGKSETVSLMINEEDHLRIQVIRSGFELKNTWNTIDEIDNILGENLNFAFSSRFGFLTACPTNVGTGMRVSVMLHLPALGMTKHIEKVFNAVGKLGLVVRGLYGEGTKVSGDLYQISNQFALGKSEKEILSIIESVIPRITSYERMARKALVMESKDQLEDRIWRSYGMLKAARMITSEEILQLLSQVRMGVNLGLIEDIEIQTLNELFVLTLPAHLQKLQGCELDSAQRNVIRASYVRKRLEGL